MHYLQLSIKEFMLFSVEITVSPYSRIDCNVCVCVCVFCRCLWCCLHCKPVIRALKPVSLQPVLYRASLLTWTPPSCLLLLVHSMLRTIQTPSLITGITQIYIQRGNLQSTAIGDALKYKVIGRNQTFWTHWVKKINLKAEY